MCSISTPRYNFDLHIASIQRKQRLSIFIVGMYLILVGCEYKNCIPNIKYSHIILIKKLLC